MPRFRQYLQDPWLFATFGALAIILAGFKVLHVAPHHQVFYENDPMYSRPSLPDTIPPWALNFFVYVAYIPFVFLPLPLASRG